MALTINFDTDRVERISRNLGILTGTIDFDSSYPTGGELLTGISNKFMRLLRVTFDQKSGYLFEFDKANNKVKVLHPTRQITPSGSNTSESAHTHTENTAATYTQNATTGAGSAHNHTFTGATVAANVGTEVPNATDLSGLTGVSFIAVGLR